MFSSRHLEKLHPKTRFRKQAEEEVVEKQRKKQNQKEKEVRRQGFDMWEDESYGN